MEISFATLKTCSTAADTVVVIDVVRAFTTAAYAFGAGAARVLLAGTVEEALALREQFPGALVMGEVGGKPVPAFDLWNSPVQASRAMLDGKTLVQRTSAGTQGIVRSTGAKYLFAASFAVAGATARAVRALSPRAVTFVVTGAHDDDLRYGLEDRACADYLAELLLAKDPDPRSYMGWLDDFIAVHRLNEAGEPLRSQFYADLELCRLVDRFSYAMPVYRRDGLLVMEKV